STFDGFRSRWRIPSSWSASTPRTSWGNTARSRDNAPSGGPPPRTPLLLGAPKSNGWGSSVPLRLWLLGGTPVASLLGDGGPALLESMASWVVTVSKPSGVTRVPPHTQASNGIPSTSSIVKLHVPPSENRS